MKIPEKYNNYKLCFVKSSEYIDEPMILYFTELQDVTKQWGDDWNDIPYEHNAGEPYEFDYTQKEKGVKNGVGIYPPIDIFKIIISGECGISTPRTEILNSPYSVEAINKGIIPWITIINDNNTKYIKAGTTLEDTLKILKKNRKYINIYIELKDE